MNIKDVKYELRKINDQFKLDNGSVLMMLSTKEIQEIVSKTFYEEEQVAVIDFLTFKI